MKNKGYEKFGGANKAHNGKVEVAYKRLEYGRVVKFVVCSERELSLGAWIRKDLFPLEASEHVTLR